jgi:hypothetical protein
MLCNHPGEEGLRREGLHARHMSSVTRLQAHRPAEERTVVLRRTIPVYHKRIRVPLLRRGMVWVRARTEQG